MKSNKHRLLLSLLLISLLTVCGKKESTDIPTGKAVRGTVLVDLYEEGEIEAIKSTNIIAPRISWRYGNLKITEMVKDGQEVAAGDTLIVFDPSEVHKSIVDAESSLEIAHAEYDRMVAQHESDLEDLRAAYEVARISHEISKIRFESSVHESEIMKKQIELNLDKAQIALQRAKEQIENRIKIQHEEVKQRDLSIAQFIARLNEAYETLNLLNVVSPSSGIAIIERNRSSDNKFQIGDQCWSGLPIIQLPDLSVLKAKAQINEVDISKIEVGLDVEIKPDAFSDSIFIGHVSSIANLAINKERSTKIKVFPIEILLKETDKNLLPGLTVSCRIIIDKIDDVLFIPLDALNRDEETSFVYKKSGESFTKVQVETGQQNIDYIVILSGLKEGDEVALINPFATDGDKDKEDKNRSA